MIIHPFRVYVAAPRVLAKAAENLAIAVEAACPGAVVIERWFEQDLPDSDDEFSVFDQCQVAIRQMEAVRSADYFVFIRGTEANGSCIEYGMALAWIGPARCFVLRSDAFEAKGSQFDRLADGQGTSDASVVGAVARAMSRNYV